MMPCISTPLHAQTVCMPGFATYCDYQFAFGYWVAAPTIAIDDQGRFAVAWQQYGPGMIPPPERNILVQRFSADATPFGSAFYLAERNVNCTTDLHTDPSLAMNRAGDVHLAWLSQCSGGGIHQPCCGDPEPCVCSWSNRRVLHAFFPFASQPSTTAAGDLLGDYTYDGSPSTGYGISASSAWTRSWQTAYAPCPPSEIVGLLRDPPSSVLRSCDGCSPQPVTLCFIDDWAPCVSARTDSKFAVAWCDPEVPTDADSKFNILARIFDASGAALTAEVFVNDPAAVPSPEVFPSSQKWPSVSFDDAGNLIVVWVGPQFAACSSLAPQFRIFGRRLIFDPIAQSLRDPIPAAGEGIAGVFIVDTRSGTVEPPRPLDPPDTRPAVALTLDPNNAGAFIVAWNAVGPNHDEEIRGQYFNRFGVPKGLEFRLNADNSPLPWASKGQRRMAPSARHTLVYGTQGQVLATFRHGAFGYSSGDDYLAFTYIPAGYSDVLDQETACCKGDMNGNGIVNGLDIQPFINTLLSQPALAICESWTTNYFTLLCPADTNNDGAVTVEDIPTFVTLLLEGAICNGGLSRGMADCNANGVPDANDLANGTSLDCNQNFIPDECDIDTNDPDGDGLVSADVNGNGVPDECEPDCNHNGIPDAWDIAQHTSNDVDADGIPDECEPDCNANGLPDGYDIAQQTSADCNANGIPDECEYDCNANGVPDDCDTDPNDPDGNGLVSPDCNANGWPDECDLAMGPPLGSLDCNENGVPDECDIASGYSQDANANQIPDECEGGAFGGDGPMQGGETWDGDTGGTPMLQTPEEVEAAWQAFYEWAERQCWGPNCATAGAEQFQAYADKLAELGLPLGGAQ